MFIGRSTAEFTSKASAVLEHQLGKLKTDILSSKKLIPTVPFDNYCSSCKDMYSDKLRWMRAHTWGSCLVGEPCNLSAIQSDLQFPPGGMTSGDQLACYNSISRRIINFKDINFGFWNFRFSNVWYLLVLLECHKPIWEKISLALRYFAATQFSCPAGKTRQDSNRVLPDSGCYIEHDNITRLWLTGLFQTYRS